MRIAFCRLAVGIAAFGLLAIAQGQTSGSFTSSNTAVDGRVARGTMGFPGRQSFPGTPVTGAAYSAQRVSEHVQVGADGTRFTNTNQQETIYRDSQGRIRTERTVMVGPNPQPAEAPVIVEIQDPVANAAYTLDPQNKVAHRVAYATPPNAKGGGVAMERSGNFTAAMGANGTMTVVAPPPPPPPGGALLGAILTTPVPSRVVATATAGDGRVHPEIRSEDLGQQVIEGVTAEGHRTVQTWPAGAMGNDRPFQVVSENWFSPEIKETVLSKSTDPRSGESTTKLININRAEPSSSLFMPPADYTVVEETGPFQVQWTGAKQ